MNTFMNNSKSNILFIILIIGLCICSSLNIIQYKIINKNRLIIESKKDSIRISKSTINNILYYRSYEIASEGLFFNGYCLVEDINGIKKQMKEILADSLMVFRFSEYNCLECIPYFIDKIKALEKLKPFANVIILCDFSNIQKVKAFCADNNLVYPIYRLIDIPLFPIEKTGLPYFFLIDHNLRCHSFQSALKSDIRFLNTYFQNVNYF